MEKHVIYCRCGAKYLRPKTVKKIASCNKCNVFLRWIGEME